MCCARGRRNFRRLASRRRRAVRGPIGGRTSSRCCASSICCSSKGLTLAGARRKLEEETAPVAANVPVIDELIGQNARERLTDVKRGLRSILDLLAGRGSSDEFRLSPPAAASARRPGAAAAARVKPSRGKAAASRNGSRARLPTLSALIRSGDDGNVRLQPDDAYRDVAQPG